MMVSTLLVMQMILPFSLKFVKKPTTIDDYEDFARKYLMEDIYRFYSSGSIMGLQQTALENTAAFSRSVSSCIDVRQFAFDNKFSCSIHALLYYCNMQISYYIIIALWL